MKKLTRQSLTELAQTMPVMGDQEQRSCKGGDRYYKSDGTLIEDTGSGSNLYLERGNGFSSLQGLSLTEQSKFLTSMAKETFSFEGVVAVQKYPSDSTFEAVAVFTSPSTLAINQDYLHLFTNYHNLQSLLVHEGTHYAGVSSGGGLNANELQAYEAQVAHSSFAGTTTEFKKMTAEAWYAAYQEIKGTSGVETQASFYVKCGLKSNGTAK